MAITPRDYWISTPIVIMIVGAPAALIPVSLQRDGRASGGPPPIAGYTGRSEQ
jgi:hypothetical protein